MEESRRTESGFVNSPYVVIEPGYPRVHGTISRYPSTFVTTGISCQQPTSRYGSAAVHCSVCPVSSRVEGPNYHDWVRRMSSWSGLNSLPLDMPWKPLEGPFLAVPHWGFCTNQFHVKGLLTALEYKWYNLHEEKPERLRPCQRVLGLWYGSPSVIQRFVES